MPARKASLDPGADRLRLLGLSVGEQIDWPAPGGKTLKLNCWPWSTSRKRRAIST
jgi:hypothetical protein